ncbi:MarR family winged helix-turn-helix transcriptional regulator [Bacillus sp. Marseille-Q3570]|uniref:MarR family winged helix-turn-helix transcriptional regulator n=1 Tax=Bacillus sp. Marseille-Q3570 TaxID=2963522 RepID=UPI0021B7794D|nr:MarR family winged helix-turn-helix transcriptional regulator [Bacillus sp. Marseille-Q3570]
MCNEEIRKFNRFYTRVLGLVNQYSETSLFSLLESQILYEIYARDVCIQNELCEYFSIDKGYMSRILNKFSAQELIVKRPYELDKRKIQLVITEKGEEQTKTLIDSSNFYVNRMIKDIPASELNKLIASMKTIEEILNKQVDIQ